MSCHVCCLQLLAFFFGKVLRKVEVGKVGRFWSCVWLVGRCGARFHGLLARVDLNFVRCVVGWGRVVVVVIIFIVGRVGLVCVVVDGMGWEVVEGFLI